MDSSNLCFNCPGNTTKAMCIAKRLSLANNPKLRYDIYNGMNEHGHDTSKISRDSDGTWYYNESEPIVHQVNSALQGGEQQPKPKADRKPKALNYPKVIPIRLSETTHAKIIQHVSAKGLKMGEVLRNLVDKYLAEQEGMQ